MSPPSPLYLLLCCQTDFPIQNRCTAVAADTYFPLSPEGQAAGVEEPPASQGRTSAQEMPGDAQEQPGEEAVQSSVGLEGHKGLQQAQMVAAVK